MIVFWGRENKTLFFPNSVEERITYYLFSSSLFLGGEGGGGGKLKKEIRLLGRVSKSLFFP